MANTVAASNSSFIHNLFAPPSDPQGPQETDLAHHASLYLETAEGAWDLFRVINQVLSFVLRLPFLSESGRDLANRSLNVVDTAGIGLSIPQIASNANDLRHSLSRLSTARDLPADDPSRDRRIAQAAKNSFLGAMNVTNSVSQALLFLERVKIVVLNALHTDILNGVYNVTGGIVDAVEFVGECFKQSQYASDELQAHTPLEQARLEEKKRLSWGTMVKDTASVGLAVIALLGLIFGAAFGGTAMVTIGLVLSAVWLSAKIGTYFYNKIVISAHTPVRLAI